ncbi:MAG: phenylalanine--tRNA ligase beta subunit [Porticoccaceae bacterium]|nr:MAG: phenylalanine--tRNA ligase beta subunit [Porticoccaceae bacterium]
MRVSESWLREWVDPPLSTRELAERLTLGGLEVSGVTPAAPDFAGVVVGEILAVEPHPRADRLSLCAVAVGEAAPLAVVCGAPNARPGLKVPVARVGARLPDGTAIRAARIRGVESQGMLCGADELGLGELDEGDGLWELPADAPLGEDLRVYLGLDDAVLEVDLTPNRGDCLGVRGLAREVAALAGATWRAPTWTPVPAAGEAYRDVRLAAGSACPRYLGRVVEGLARTARSPLWLRERLRRAGLRPIDPVVDVTNYVMLELGQPLHAFDLEKLHGDLEVRFARRGERLELLDGRKASLDEDVLVIADQAGVAAVAGIMGGRRTAVEESTRAVFLESAHFAPQAVAGRARRLGLATEASHRFERGVDPELCELALERATQLLVEIAGGRPGPVVRAERPEELPAPREIRLRRERLAGLLGVALPDAEVEDLLGRLGLQLRERDGGGWRYGVPSWRFDLALEADLVEEVARLYGYARLPQRLPAAPLAPGGAPEATLPPDSLRQILIARGFREVITYSFVDPKLLHLLDPAGRPIPLQNPISAEMSAMRTTLWAGLVEVARRNLHRRQRRIAVFEIGRRFAGGERYREEPVIAGLLCGEREAENWCGDRAEVDFYDLKGHLEALLAPTGAEEEFRFRRAEHPALHPGQCALLERAGEPVGYLGRLHPGLLDQLELEREVLLFELALEPLLGARLPVAGAPSRHPPVRRDLAVVVDRDLPVAELLAGVRAAAGERLVDLCVFDVYQGEGIEPGRKSVALGLTFQDPSRTLEEAEIQALVESVVGALAQRFHATLRG